MRTIFLASVLVSLTLVLSYCSASKKAAKAPKTAYATGVQPLILANCSPCHIPAKNGNKKALDTYDAAKANIDTIIARIELTPGQKGFMPSRKPKLSDSIIAVFKKWKADGLVQN